MCVRQTSLRLFPLSEDCTAPPPRLAMQQPALMTPRSPHSPHSGQEVPLSPLSLQTPHTPLYLLSPTADAAAYALSGGLGVAAAGGYHSSIEVLASGGGPGDVFNLESLQVRECLVWKCPRI